jgi:DNA-binding NarL/FixJ family response regulator
VPNIEVERGVSPDNALKVNNRANLGDSERLALPSSRSAVGTIVNTVLHAPNGRYCSPDAARNSPDDGAKQRSIEQRDGYQFLTALDLPGSQERPGWDLVSPEARRSALGWRLPEAHRSLHDLRLLIIDDCTLYRENLAATFVANGSATPAVAWDLSSLVTALDGAAAPSIVLLQIGTKDSLMLLRAALQISPGVRVVVLGVSEDDVSDIVGCAEAGVAGYHMRTESLADLLELIVKVAAGASVCPPGVSAILLNRLSALAAQRRPSPIKEVILTAREVQILRMLEMGLSNREIAARLSIAVHTVKNHVHSVLTKLGVTTRAEAAARSRSVRFAEDRSGN